MRKIFFISVFLGSCIFLWSTTHADEDYAAQLKEEAAAMDGFVEDKAMDKGDKIDEDRQEERGDAPPKGKAPAEDVQMDKGTKASQIEPVSEDAAEDKGDPFPDSSPPDEDHELDKGD